MITYLQILENLHFNLYNLVTFLFNFDKLNSISSFTKLFGKFSKHLIRYKIYRVKYSAVNTLILSLKFYNNWSILLTFSIKLHRGVNLVSNLHLLFIIIGQFYRLTRFTLIYFSFLD